MENQIAGYRLSPQQRDLWRFQGGGDPAGFCVQCAVTADGELDFDALRAALERVARDHEILRTTFQKLPGTTVPVQVIEDGVVPSLEIVDLAGVAEDDQQARVTELMAAARERRLDVGQGPLLCVNAVQLAADRSLLVLTMPALCGDDSGVANLAREIGRAYAAVRGESGDDAEPMQYADLAEWQNELLAEGEDEQRFTDPTAATIDLSFLDGAGSSGRFRPDLVGATLDAPLTAAVRKAAADLDVSESTLLLACWQLLLLRVTGQDEVTLGVAFDGRSYEGLDEALGLFAKDLPLTARLDADQPFADFAKAVDAASSELQDQQEYFTWERFAHGATNGSAPYFPVCYGFVDGGAGFDAGGVSFSFARHYSCTQRFSLKLVCARRADELVAELYYDAEQFGIDGVQRLSRYFRALVQSALADPTAPVGALELIDDAERQTVLVDFNQTNADIDAEQCVHDLIAAHARTRPDAVAVACGSSQLTYAELDARANRVARRLQDLGVGPDALVGLCVDRSVEMIVGILGALKAGGAYVPLDPTYPRERLAFMVEDTATPVVLTLSHLVDLLGDHSATAVRLDVDDDLSSDDTAPDTEVTPDNLAYIIYTSGSTGRPKGVEIAHRNLVHSTLARRHTYDSAPDAYLLLSSFSFDSSIVGIFWTLCEGGKLVLPVEGNERDLHELTTLIAEHSITHTLALPSLYGLLLNETRGDGLGSLQCVIVAGEACPRELVDLHAEVLPGAALFNEYGPTEATVWSSVHRCSPSDPARVPIGRPIANARIYLLDAARQPVPIGVPGEMYVGGPGVTRGYLRRPELTEEKFVADPFAAGERLYRTGDLASFRPDGVIDFLGRVDNQVKIRGYRIELEEIEEVLRGDASVDQAVVVAREVAPGDKRLVAFVVPAGSASPSAEALSELVGASLPSYMVPSSFAVLQDLPLMPNGKVDRGALADLDESGMASGPEYVAPRDAIEQALCGIWEEVLKRDSIGVHHNFFQLGGHSLLVTQLIFRLRELFDVEVSLRAVFDNPTVAELTSVLAADAEARVRLEQIAAAKGDA